MKNYKFVIKGKVQGVWYRKTICSNANKMNVSGYVKNLENGDVEAACSIEEAALETFVAMLKKGSLASRVKSVVMQECTEAFSGAFEIR